MADSGDGWCQAAIKPITWKKRRINMLSLQNDQFHGSTFITGSTWPTLLSPLQGNLISTARCPYCPSSHLEALPVWCGLMRVWATELGFRIYSHQAHHCSRKAKGHTHTYVHWLKENVLLLVRSSLWPGLNDCQTVRRPWACGKGMY